MNKLAFFLITLSAIATIYNSKLNVVYSDNLKSCAEQNQLEQERFNKQVLDNILSSFKIDLTGYKELAFWETNKKIRLEGRKQEAETFAELFLGYSNGDRKLFVKSENNQITGYLLYKNLDGTNVVQIVAKENDSWKVIKTQTKNAKRFYANFKNCYEDS